MPAKMGPVIGAQAAPRASKAKAPAAPEPAQAKAPAPRKSKAAAVPSEFDELSNLAASTKVLEDEIRAQTGGQNTWIKVIQGGANEVTKGTPEYIKGAEAGDFLVPVGDGKCVVKETLRVTPVGMFKIYSEKKPGASPSEMAQTVSFWLPEDAEQIPLASGDNFKRLLPNGNYLQPMHWMFVYVHELPELKDALIPFQSIGNSYYAKIVKTVKANSAIAAELVLDLKTEGKMNEEFHKMYFYPVAEVASKNFDFAADTGKVTLLKGGADAAKVKAILTLSNEMQKQYKELKLVTKRTPQQLLISAGPQAPIERKGLPGSTKGGYAQDDEEEGPKF